MQIPPFARQREPDRAKPQAKGGGPASLRAGGVVTMICGLKKPPVCALFLDASRYRVRASGAQPPLLQKEGIFLILTSSEII